jgi:polyisoprenoid-binding protein YceI
VRAYTLPLWLWAAAAGAAPRYDLVTGAPPVDEDAEAPTEAPPPTFGLDPATSRIEARLGPDPRTLDSGRSHAHVIRATGWTGWLTLADGAACDGELNLPVTGFVVDDPAHRREAGLEEPLRDADRAEVRAHMLAPDQLFAERFPQVAFVIERCAAVPDGGWDVTGRLSLHGVSRPMTVRLAGGPVAGGVQLQGEAVIRQTEFGIEPYFALFGQRRNRDAVELRFDLRGAPAEPPARTTRLPRL